MTAAQFLAGSNMSTTTSEQVDFSSLINLHVHFPRQLAMAGQAELFLRCNIEPGDKGWRFLGEVKGDVKKRTYHDDLINTGRKLLQYGNEGLVKRFSGYYLSMGWSRQQVFREESKEWPQDLIAAICEKSNEALQAPDITRPYKRQKRCENTGLKTSDQTQTSNQAQPQLRLDATAEATQAGPRMISQTDPQQVNNSTAASHVSKSTLDADSQPPRQREISSIDTGLQLEQTGTLNQDQAYSPPRPNTTPRIYSDQNQMPILVTSCADLWKEYLGDELFDGVTKSQKRCSEQEANMTETVFLHFPKERGLDFTLEVWLCRSIGEKVQTSLGSDETLRCVLGDYLFNAVGASKSDWESAVCVTLPDDAGGDSRLKLKVCFSTGGELYRELYKNAYRVC